MALTLCLLVYVGGSRFQRPGSSPTLGSLGPSQQRHHKSRVSLRGPPCAHGVASTPHGEVRDMLQNTIVNTHIYPSNRLAPALAPTPNSNLQRSLTTTSPTPATISHVYKSPAPYSFISNCLPILVRSVGSQIICYTHLLFSKKFKYS